MEVGEHADERAGVDEECAHDVRQQRDPDAGQRHAPDERDVVGGHRASDVDLDAARLECSTERALALRELNRTHECFARSSTVRGAPARLTYAGQIGGSADPARGMTERGMTGRRRALLSPR